MHAICKWHIDLVIPLHEEIFFLAESGEREILDRLFAPPFELLIRLHNKWEFTKMMRRLRMDVPEAQLCRNYADVERLPVDKYKNGMALKPCFGRANTVVYHLKPGEPLPKAEELQIGGDNQYIAQEWIKGNRYCSYSIVRDGRVEATGVYPVIETIDGSSSVYFKQKYHAGIYRYIDEFVRRCTKISGPFSGQIAFDFIEDPTSNRIMTMECNPRATSGLHLWTRTPCLAYILTNSLPHVRPEDKHVQPPTSRILHRPAHAQVSAGMLMWEHKDATLKVWATHMARLVGTRDVVFAWRDIMPTISQPFLLSVYFQEARKAGIQMPQIFQQPLLWKPDGQHLAEVRKMMEEADARDEEKANRAASELELQPMRTGMSEAQTAEVGNMDGALDLRGEHFGDESPVLGRKALPKVPPMKETLRDSAISAEGATDVTDKA
jgi:hypothetical protein